MENKIVLEKEEVRKTMEDCREQVKYWENEYRNAEDGFYKKCYKRQVDMWLARFEVYRDIYEKEANSDEG